MNLATASVMAEAALRHAVESGATLSVSVVDASGRLVLCHRADGAAYLSTETSFAKAAAAAAFRVPTKLITEIHDKKPGFLEQCRTRKSGTHPAKHWSNSHFY